MLGFPIWFTTESYRTSGLDGFFGGGTIIEDFPMQYCPTRTRARYMKRPPTPPPAYPTEYWASLAKYTPRPKAVPGKIGKIHFSNCTEWMETTKPLRYKSQNSVFRRAFKDRLQRHTIHPTTRPITRNITSDRSP